MFELESLSGRFVRDVVMKASQFQYHECHAALYSDIVYL